MNANDIQVGAEVLIECGGYSLRYEKAKVCRVTATWFIVKQNHEGAIEERFNKSTLREVGGNGKSMMRLAILIVDPAKIKETLERETNRRARQTLEREAKAALDRALKNVFDMTSQELQDLVIRFPEPKAK